MPAPAISSTNPTSAPEPPGRLAGSGTMRTAALVAGASLMAMSALAGFAIFVVVDGLTTPGDAARTAADISASEGTFRLGVLSLYAVVVLDVLIAWALLRVFSPVSTHLSRIAAWFRLAYAAVFMVAITELAGVPRLLEGDGYAATLTDADRQGQVVLALDAFQDIWMASLILFGFHLLVIGYLAFASGYVPRVLGALVAVAGFGYVFDSAGFVLSPDAPVISTVTFVGEFLLGVWLLARSHRLPEGQVGHEI